MVETNAAKVGINFGLLVSVFFPFPFFLPLVFQFMQMVGSRNFAGSKNLPVEWQRIDYDLNMHMQWQNGRNSRLFFGKLLKNVFQAAALFLHGKNGQAIINCKSENFLPHIQVFGRFNQPGITSDVFNAHYALD